MLLAEIEVRHSRTVAPTRRVALGLTLLPTDPLPGWGPVLLGGLVAANVGHLNPELVPGIHHLVNDLETGIRITQPRLRHRFQRDTVGLDRSRHSLIGDGEDIWFDLDDHARPEVNVLGAVYAAADLPEAARPLAFRVLKKALHWERTLDASFIAHLLGDNATFSRWRALPAERRWALRLFGFGPHDEPRREDIQLRFREAAMNAHPDRGGDSGDAGRRMVDLTQARQLLIG